MAAAVAVVVGVDMAVQVVGMVMVMDLGSVEEDKEVLDCWPVVDRVVH